MIYAGILAGGVGSRMTGATVPKQFFPIGGKPILVHTAEKFLMCDKFQKIYIAVVGGYLDLAQSMIDEYIDKSLAARISVIEGGGDRSGSILKVIERIYEDGGDEKSILVSHDSVRPFVNLAALEENIRLISGGCCDCAGTAVPSIDTVFEIDKGGFVTSIPDRSRLCNAQTPQTFTVGEFLECYGRLSPADKAALTDACAVFLRCGKRVLTAKGSSDNIKITTPFDMKLAESILNESSNFHGFSDI
ncbi:MAG: 2-C-methyl-D-erythritol 4-phosphate cytidylyltransferase [Oscillospiraceae bacterium]|nr:2-C-methyl-D-erythritol 4-phosphate cytidylyltransferase [Oscillospiraceae bacterium]